MKGYYIEVLIYQLVFYLIGYLTKYRGNLLPVSKKLGMLIFFDKNVYKSRLMSILICAYTECTFLFTLLFAFVLAPNNVEYAENINCMVWAGALFIAGVTFIEHFRNEADSVFEKVVSIICSIVLLVFSVLWMGDIVYAFFKLSN